MKKKFTKRAGGRFFAFFLAVLIVITSMTPVDMQVNAEEKQVYTSTENTEEETVATAASGETETGKAAGAKAGETQSSETKAAEEKSVQTEATDASTSTAATTEATETATTETATTETESTQVLENWVKSETVDQVTITVEADPGVFPEKASLRVKKVTNEAVQDKMEEAVEEKLKESSDSQKPTIQDMIVFDITILNEKGEEIQPDTSKGKVTVSFQNLQLAADSQNIESFHINDDLSQVEMLDTTVHTDENTVEVPAEHFSYYGVATGNSVKSATVNGLTITQTSADGEFKTYTTSLNQGMIAITKAGDYTITGTYKDENNDEKNWARVSSDFWRGIIDTSSVPYGTVNLTIDNVHITTGYAGNMPMIVSRGENSGQGDLNLILKGTNELEVGSVASEWKAAGGGAAIVKQEGSGKLTFLGDGTLTVKSPEMTIGAAPVVYSGNRIITYNCQNIYFNQTGVINAVTECTTGDYWSSIGTLPQFIRENGRTSIEDRSTRNIVFNSGTLNIIYQVCDKRIGDFVSPFTLIGTTVKEDQKYSHSDNIQVNGGKINISMPATTRLYYILGNQAMPNGGVTITGGTIVYYDILRLSSVVTHYFREENHEEWKRQVTS